MPVLFSALVVVSFSMYFFNHDVTLDAFVRFGYPMYLIYPLGVAKVLGLVAIWAKKSEFLKNLAYAGFFFNGVLALFAHIMVGDPINGYIHGIVFLVFVTISYFYEKKSLNKKATEYLLEQNWRTPVFALVPDSGTAWNRLVAELTAWGASYYAEN